MSIGVTDVPQWEWKPLATRGSHGVMARVLLVTRDLVTVLARFDRHASLNEHASPNPVDVVCLEGSGRASLRVDATGHATDRISEGRRLRWPPDMLHRLWTEDEEMTVLMLEHMGAAAASASRRTPRS